MPRPEMPEVRDGFHFCGGHLALALPATLAARRKESPRELLLTPSDLDRWFVAAALSSGARAAKSADLELARALRETIYRLCLQRINREPLSVGDRRQLNRWASAPAAVPRLDSEGYVHLVGNARRLLIGIAQSAAYLLGGEQGDMLRHCEGLGCALLFLDTSRAGDRRWCSMSTCGNKSKVAEFRRRVRKSK